jgi:hypothetical protein
VIWLGVYLVVAALSWLLVSGLFYAQDARRFPLIFDRREAAGDAIAWGLLYGLAWPFGVPAAYCLTGFAKYGWLFPGSSISVEGER